MVYEKRAVWLVIYVRKKPSTKLPIAIVDGHARSPKATARLGSFVSLLRPASVICVSVRKSNVRLAATGTVVFHPPR